MTDFITIGLLLGLSGGFAPGPLLTLVISETLRYDIKSGVRVAVAPIFTDLPIIILTLTVFFQLPAFHKVLGIISLIGGCVVLYMGWESMNPKPPGGADYSEEKPKSLAKGILTNFLSPHPYLFWISVAGPIMNRAMNQSYMSLFAFIATFFLLLIGSKIFVALLVSRSKHFLSTTLYVYTMRFLGLALCLLALFLFHDGLKLLGILNI